MEGPITIIYGIRQEHNRPFQVTDIERS